MLQNQHHTASLILFTLTKWYIITTISLGVLRYCSLLFWGSLFGDTKANTPINIEVGVSAPSSILYQKQQVDYLLSKSFVQTTNISNNCFIFALQQLLKITVFSFEFTASKHHTGVVSLSSIYSVFSDCCKSEGATPYFFYNLNIFSNATIRKKFTKHIGYWCVGNGSFTKRSRKSIVSTTRFTKLIAHTLAQYPNFIERCLYSTYSQRNPILPFWNRHYFSGSFLQFKKTINNQGRFRITPFVEFFYALCFNFKHKAVSTRFY